LGRGDSWSIVPNNICPNNVSKMPLMRVCWAHEGTHRMGSMRMHGLFARAPEVGQGFKHLIHHRHGMLGWWPIGILPEHFFEVARLAIDEPLLELFEIGGIGHEALRQ
jgi:hypothetical protein